MAGLNAAEEQDFLRLLRKAYETVSQVAESEAAEARSAAREPHEAAARQKAAARAVQRAALGANPRARRRKSQSAS
jgi:hypothetical protein